MRMTCFYWQNYKPTKPVPHAKKRRTSLGTTYKLPKEQRCRCRLTVKSFERKYWYISFGQRYNRHNSHLRAGEDENDLSLSDESEVCAAPGCDDEDDVESGNMSLILKTEEKSEAVYQDESLSRGMAERGVKHNEEKATQTQADDGTIVYYQCESYRAGLLQTVFDELAPLLDRAPSYLTTTTMDYLMMQWLS